MTSRLSGILRAYTSTKPLITRRCFHAARAQNNQRASAKLFADAEQEEAEQARNPTPSTSKIPQLQSQDENWTGDESLQDAVLRMLVDKYKPMRTGFVRTADTKLREAPPKVHAETYVVERSAEAWQEIANKPLLPSVEGHKPWHTTYKAPSHASASIKFGNFAPVSARTSGVSGVEDERTRKTERELAKRKEQVGRLTQARESTLDYRLGLKNSDGQLAAHPNPVNIKGWQALVEDKIEVGSVTRFELYSTYTRGRKLELLDTLTNSKDGVGPLLEQARSVTLLLREKNSS